MGLKWVDFRVTGYPGCIPYDWLLGPLLTENGSPP